MNKLFSDCKSDQEKYKFFLLGHGYESGVISRAIQNDVAMAYQRCANFEIELRRLHEVNAELLEALKRIVDANPRLWDADVRDQFEPWAKNRARAAIANVNRESA